MVNKIINIDVDYKAMGVEPSPRQTTLTTYIIDNNNIKLSSWRKRPAVIVCPGGGYSMTSEREAEVIALRYAAAGYHAFILDYSVAPSSYPAALCELSKAVAYVKGIADENCIDKDNIYVCGFSAGGHLVASLGVHHSRPEVLKYSGLKEGENIPAGLILGYPVIRNEEGKTHKGTIDNFSKGNEEYRKLAGLNKFVSKDTPPSFIWATAKDEAVPVSSSLAFAAALDENDVDFELHIFPIGPHGISLADETTDVWEDGTGLIPSAQNWMEMSVRWIKMRALNIK